MHCFLILSLCIPIFCTCTPSAYILCSDRELAQLSVWIWCCYSPCDHPWERLYWIHGGDVPSVHLLGKVIKRKENVDQILCVWIIACKEFQCALQRSENWFEWSKTVVFLQCFLCHFLCHSLPIIGLFCIVSRL